MVASGQSEAKNKETVFFTFIIPIDISLSTVVRTKMSPNMYLFSASGFLLFLAQYVDKIFEKRSKELSTNCGSQINLNRI